MYNILIHRYFYNFTTASSFKLKLSQQKISNLQSVFFLEHHHIHQDFLFGKLFVFKNQKSFPF